MNPLEYSGAAMIGPLVPHKLALSCTIYCRTPRLTPFTSPRLRICINAGAIGKVIAVHITLADYYPHKPNDGHWEKAKSGGGPLIDLGSHCIDLLMISAARCWR